MQRAGATERHETEVARVQPALNSGQPQSAKHIFIDDIDNTLSSFVQVEIERASQGANYVLGCLGVQWHTATQQRFRKSP